MTVGVILTNIGTPASSDPNTVGQFLREFLYDGRVIDLPTPLRWLLVKGIIVPFRKKKAAKAYQAIWGENGHSPFLTHSIDLQSALSDVLGSQFKVLLGMQYGTPSLKAAVAQLIKDPNLKKIIFVPLYPQYAAATTASSIAQFEKAISEYWDIIPYKIIPDFYSTNAFINAFSKVIETTLDNFNSDHVLFSYHGLPERQIKKSDPTQHHCLKDPDCCISPNAPHRCYRSQCIKTTKLLAKKLSFDTTYYSTSFQSRLGKQPWIKPYTTEMLKELYKRGFKNIAIACPAFVVDCLETLEEIAIGAREDWKSMGGEELVLIPSLNASPIWVEGLAQLVKSN